MWMPNNHVFNFLFQNLDALHDHLATIYPGMRAPSFRCTDAEKGKGLILHYYSEREGLQDIVIGIIKTVAQQIHGTEIDMKVMSEGIYTLEVYVIRTKSRKSKVKWCQSFSFLLSTVKQWHQYWLRKSHHHLCCFKDRSAMCWEGQH